MTDRRELQPTLAPPTQDRPEFSMSARAGTTTTAGLPVALLRALEPVTPNSISVERRELTPSPNSSPA